LKETELKNTKERKATDRPPEEADSREEIWEAQGLLKAEILSSMSSFAVRAT
jgi:hypothetical protein